MNATKNRTLWAKLNRTWEKKHLPDGGLLLRDLRPAFSDVSSEELDKTLIAWMYEGRMEIFPFDDYARITPEDREAAIILAGREAYIVLLNPFYEEEPEEVQVEKITVRKVA